MLDVGPNNCCYKDVLLFFIRKLYGPEWTGMRAYMRPSETDNDVLSTENPAVSFDHILCDICTEKKAVCYCLDCEKKLCDHDFKVRISFVMRGHYRWPVCVNGAD